MRRFAVALCAASAVAVSSNARAADVEQTPVEYYRATSFSLNTGMDLVAALITGGWTGLATQFGNTSAAGVVGISASARFVYSGLVMGAQLGLQYFHGLTADTIFEPGLTIGYAIPLTDRLALTPAFHTIFELTPTTGSSAVIQLTGEVGLEVFLGKHGFIEPVIAMGDLQNTGTGTSGQGTFIFGVGYRLGVVF